MFFPELFNLGNSFKKYFEIVPAHSETLKNEAFRVRHDVYCKDLKFESEQTNELETDEYDAQSLHLLIRNVTTKEFIGCTRIVLPNQDNPKLLLPFEKICDGAIDQSILESFELTRINVAEVSRLAVISRYRRRKSDPIKSPVSISKEDYGSANQPRFPYIPIGLFMGTIELAQLNGIDYIFMLTERRLADHFKKLGANLQFIGEPIEHRGKRLPSILNINETIKEMRFIFRPLFKTIKSDIKRNLNS